jgi:3-deoxy-manno-octulosonate cytidylyltransferase (CMP-KDO synthetase)
MNPPILGVIPARLGSARLPRKPLHPLAGRPLIAWVWQRALESRLFAALVVATDSEEVAAAVRGFGGEVELTAAEHASGTDRVAEIAALPPYRGFACILNLQGDEPFVRASDLAAAARLVTEAGWEVGTVAAPIRSVAELADPAVVKVVRDERGGALYFSRAPIPFTRDGPPALDGAGGGPFLRHLGIYAYRRDALLRWVGLPPGTLERVEMLEQLRPLAAGIRIGVALVASGEAGVDTPADAARAESLLLHHLASGVPS